VARLPDEAGRLFPATCRCAQTDPFAGEAPGLRRDGDLVQSGTGSMGR
jgi:hypothetical protein